MVQNVHVVLTLDDLIAIAVFVIAVLFLIAVLLLHVFVECFKFVEDRRDRMRARVSVV
jgi:hypothetical protein